MPTRPPSYRLHRPSGQAVVTLHGRDHYLGRHDTPESHAEYDRLIAGWLLRRSEQTDQNIRHNIRGVANGHACATSVTVAQVLAAWLKRCELRYMKCGRPTGQLERTKIAIRFARQGERASLPAGQLTPAVLLEIRADIARAGHVRTMVNSLVGVLKTAWAWAVTQNMVDGSTAYALRCVRGLRWGELAGDVRVREATPVRAVPWPVVEATLPELLPATRDMLRLQHLTAMRPCEVCGLRPIDVDRKGCLPDGTRLDGVWVYVVPESHNKLAHRGQARYVFLGPKAQAILAPYLERDPSRPCFSPREAVEGWLIAHGRSIRHGQNRTPTCQYSTMALGHAVRKAAARAQRQRRRHLYRSGQLTLRQARDQAARELPHWAPNQLRHLRAKELRSQFGPDTARIVLGHSLPGTTGVYAEDDLEKAAAAARLAG